MGFVVRKGNPAKQGLKLLELGLVGVMVFCPKGKSSKTRIETGFQTLQSHDRDVRKGNPAKQGLKHYEKLDC